MKRSPLVLSLLAACLASAQAQMGPKPAHGPLNATPIPSQTNVPSKTTAPTPTFFVPQSSVVRPQDRGKRFHTNCIGYSGVWMGRGSLNHFVAMNGPAFFAIPGFHPADIMNAYQVPVNQGTGVIAIVDAFDDPTVLSDFNTFSAAFGLPQEPSADQTNPNNQVLQVVYQDGIRPPTDGGWATEVSIDVQWAHAMAPNAKIVLLEAADNSDNLFTMADFASTIPNVMEVSMSFGGDEFPSETEFDPAFEHLGVVYFASAGDTGGAQEYPATSSTVVGVGGTSLVMNGSTVSSETAWNGSGGGPSAFIARPGYQNVIANIVGGFRGSPDVAGVADPATGVAIYDTTPNQFASGWQVWGGTSVACPINAGIANSRGFWSTSSVAELQRIYGQLLGTASFRDITSGTAGTFTARVGWDFITGAGVPNSVLPVPVPPNTFAPVSASGYVFQSIDQFSSISGGAGNAGSIDGNLFSVTSVLLPGIGQVAAGELDYTLNQSAGSFTNMAIDTTASVPPKVTLQIFAYNYTTNVFDYIKAQPGNGTLKTLNVSLPNFANYVDPNTNNMRIVIRGLGPQRQAVGAFTLGIDEALIATG